MKIKTSLSLDEEVLAKAKALAKADKRSTSNYLERAIEFFVAAQADEAGVPKLHPAASRLALAGAMM